MRNLIFFFFLLCYQISFSQQNSSMFLDSLIQSYGQINDSVLAYELNRVAFSKVIRADEKGALIARKVIDISKKSNYKVGEIDAFNTIAIDFNIKGQRDSSFFYFNLYLSQSKLINDSIRIGRALNNLGLFYKQTGDYKKSIAMLIKNTEINEKIGNKRGVGIAKSNIGSAYIAMENYTRAVKYSKQAFNIRREMSDSNNLGASCNDIGICFKGMELYDSSMVYYKKGIDYAKAVNNQQQLAKLYANLGNLYVLLKDYEQGYTILMKALEYRQGKSTLAITHNNISAAAYYLKKPKEALEYAQKSYTYSKDDNGYGNLQYAYLNLANAYILNKDYEKSHEMYLKWGDAKDSVFSTENTKIIAEIETRYQTERKEKEIAKQQLEIAEKDMALYNRNKVLIALLIVVLVIISFGLYIFQNRKRKAQHKQDKAVIQEKNKGLKAVIQAQEDERKRIAKDLHDGIVQQLGGLKLGLQKVFMDSETTETNRIIEILDDSAQELRELSHKMMPRSLGELGLMPALKDMIENSLGNTSIKYQFEYFGIKDRFKENIEIAIYRIAQELVSNVIKHSNADIVNIQLFKSDNSIVFIVEDNGSGINISEKKEGIGLMNISTRLDTINGKVNYEPSPESGTLVTIKIPISQ